MREDILGNEVRKVAETEAVKHGNHLTQCLTHAPEMAAIIATFRTVSS